MKPGIFHHLLARMLVIPSVDLGGSSIKDGVLIQNLRHTYHIPSMQDLAMASTESQMLWNCTVCYYCGTFRKQSNTKLIVGVCQLCHPPKKLFWASYQYSADWMNREITLLPIIHKHALMGALHESESIRAANGNIIKEAGSKDQDN